VALAACGCTGPSPSRLGKRVPVRGKVTVNGKALTAGYVVLTPVDASKGDEQRGQVKGDGGYVTSVFPGRYNVSLASGNEAAPRYRWTRTTGLVIEVGKGGKEDANVDVR
jgi:hypothetical protein